MRHLQHVTVPKKCALRTKENPVRPDWDLNYNLPAHKVNGFFAVNLISYIKGGCESVAILTIVQNLGHCKDFLYLDLFELTIQYNNTTVKVCNTLILKLLVNIILTNNLKYLFFRRYTVK